MTHRTKRLGLVLLGLALLLGACRSAPAPTATVTPDELDPSEAITATSTAEPTALPTATEVALDGCTSCHSDKDRLIDTAAPEEEVISENEGEG